MTKRECFNRKQTNLMEVLRIVYYSILYNLFVHFSINEFAQIELWKDFWHTHCLRNGSYEFMTYRYEDFNILFIFTFTQCKSIIYVSNS